MKKYRWIFRRTKYLKWLEEQCIKPDEKEDAWVSEVENRKKTVNHCEGYVTMGAYKVLDAWCSIKEVK